MRHFYFDPFDGWREISGVERERLDHILSSFPLVYEGCRLVSFDVS